MSLKLSHSSISKYQTCPKSWEYRYKRKIVSKLKGSALYFGTAMDEALNFMVKNKDTEDLLENSYSVFCEFWSKQKDNEYKEIELAKNENITYSKYDFDYDLLEKEDWSELYKLQDNPLNYRDQIANKLYPKKEPNQKVVSWDQLTKEERVFYNYTSWLSIKRKAKYLLQAYKEQLLPKIKEVIAIQKYIDLGDEKNNIINGYIDMIVKLEDGSIAIIDNKTSSIEYSEDSVNSSPQLALYQKVLNQLNEDPNSDWKTYIDKCGYFVLSKKLDKEITKKCKSCGHIGEGSHKTCDNMIDQPMTGPGSGKPVRCGGEWEKTKKFNVDTQVIIDYISDHVQEMVLENATEVKKCIEAELFPRNLNACNGKFGKCEYYSLCWSRNNKDLVRLSDRDLEIKKDDNGKKT